MIQVKRAYDDPEPEDGTRFLVDRLWPRGIRKGELEVVDWLKDIAPSNELRQWFNHDPEKWEEFCQRYFRELDGKRAVWQAILTAARQGNITLIYGAKERQYNNAVALKSFLEREIQDG